MGVVGEQMVRVYNLLWAGHQAFGKNHFWLIIIQKGY